MDKQFILAIALSLLVLLAYQEVMRRYYPQRTRSPLPATAPTPVATAPGLPPGLPPEAASEARATTLPSADVTAETPVFQAAFSSRGARLVSLKLRHYRTAVDPQSPPLEMVRPGSGGDLPLGVTLRGESAWTDGNVEYEPSARSLVVEEGQSAQLVFRGRAEGVGEIEKRVRFDGGSYAFSVAVGVTTGLRVSELGLSWKRAAAAPHSRYQYEGAEALVGGKLLRLTEKELLQGIVVPDPRGSGAQQGPVRWAGYADTYFLSALSPREDQPARLWAKLDGGVIATEVLVPIGTGSAEPYVYTAYAGPKDLSILARAGHHLDRTVYLGWFGFVAEPMLRILKVFHSASGNYGVDIILLTVLIKVLFIPLTRKSFKSMQALQKLQPQVKKLQEKFKDDREALNKELMELYRRHNVNPLGGCLPMAFQMPIFIGLYNALLNAVELRHAPFALWINDLSAPDRLPPVPHPPLGMVAGYELRIPVLTLFMGVSMLIQQKMTPAAGDPAQQRMMMFMPLMFTVMFVNFPSGLVLYWLVNNVLTIAQQMAMQRGEK